MLEVAHTRKDAELARVARRRRRGGVRVRDLDRDCLVAVSVQHELVDAQGDELAWRGEREDVRPAQERPRRLVRRRRDGGEPKVADARLRDDDPRPYARRRARDPCG